MDGRPAVELRDVWFSYDGVYVLEDVSVTVRRGEFISMVGPNGGGKTTLLKIVLGLLRPHRGSVRVFGMPPAAAWRRVGYVPQRQIADPFFPVTVLDVVLMGRAGKARRVGPYRRMDREAAVRVLGEVGLAEAADRPFAQLSGGQQQLVLIARALASEPEMLLLDEPTSSLDVRVEQELGGLLRRLNERLTIVVVSHDLSFVSDLTEHVICVNRQVAVHPTSRVTGEGMWSVFGGPVRAVRHDRHCPPEEHDHEDVEEVY